MAKYLDLAMQDRSCGYTRTAVRKDGLYGYCRIREINIFISKKDGRINHLSDGMADMMLKEGLISRQTYDGYMKALFEDLYCFDRFDGCSVEDIYSYIAEKRASLLGNAVDEYKLIVAKRACTFYPRGIDQSAKKAELLKKRRAVIFALTQPELLGVMLDDMKKAEQNEVWVVCDSCLAGLFGEKTRVLAKSGNKIASDELLQEYIDNDNACLFVYGEEGLYACRGLRIDSVVHACPVGYHAQALTGIWNGDGCTVFVPKCSDMTKYVPLTQKTRLNYSIMYRLWLENGDSVYGMSIEQLYNKYPKYFINVYSGLPSELPICINAETLSEFDSQLDNGLTSYLSAFENAEYYSAYFDEELKCQTICYDASQNQKGILVQAVKIKQAECAEVISCEKGKTPRQMFAESNLSGTGIVSNFLFFMTQKLGVLYNSLRSDRPNEQADAASGHLDYMLADGKETFPLFAKSCIAKRDDGRFLFFNHKLGGGSVCISGISYSWQKSDVNSDVSRIRIYSPYYASTDCDADRDTYKKPVGEGRMNIVLLRDKITCLRRGDVLLPSVGVVLSLTEEDALPLLEKCKPLSDGYYDVSGLNLTTKLDPPKEIAPEEWAKVRWAYGGGMTLIRNGVGLCDGDNMEKWFEEEGWTNPLSRQTQESNLHSLVKHPRTAIGCTSDGSLVILVFSGRTWRSSGADYAEMITVARQLFPDVQYLMNCDGGGSAMLGTVRDGSFLELSFPATSPGNCAGQVRPINTLFYIPIG